MKRISLLCLCLCAAISATGCCHSYYSRNSECDGGYCCNQGRKQPRNRRCRADKANRGCNQDCCDGGCDQCCGEGGCSGGMSADGSQMTTPGQGCASGNCGTSMPTGMPTGMSSGTPMYSNMPFNPGDGWTVQSTTSQPVGNEPYPAPATTVPTPVNPPTTSSQGWTQPSSVPNPAPVPPPVSFNRR